MLTVGSLFAGIGGFDLGLERAGMRTVWFCEQDEFCQRVLAKHWPGVPVHDDVRALVGHAERDDGGPRGTWRSDPAGAGELEPSLRSGVCVPVPYVDVLCGGFPCQDISLAGAGAGLDGDRSGLWSEYARLIRELRPRYVIVENVAALLSRGLGRVLGDLAACGYDAEWDCIPASAIGAPHRRDRIWLVAYPNGEGSQGHGRPLAGAGEQSPASGGAAGREGAVGNADCVAGPASLAVDRGPQAVARPEPLERAFGSGGSFRESWLVEPDVGRVAHGVPQRVDRLRSLGNSLVPQIAEWIGHRILEWEAA